MPVKVVNRDGKYRIVEASTGELARTKTGGTIDGGGHKSKEKAQKQARAINSGRK